MGSGDDQRHPDTLSIEVDFSRFSAVLAEVEPMVAVDDDQGACKSRLVLEAGDELAHDVVGVARGVQDALLRQRMLHEVERVFGRAERRVIGNRYHARQKGPARRAELANPLRGGAEYGTVALLRVGVAAQPVVPAAEPQGRA